MAIKRTPVKSSKMILSPAEYKEVMNSIEKILNKSTKKGGFEKLSKKETDHLAKLSKMAEMYEDQKMNISSSQQTRPYRKDLKNALDFLGIKSSISNISMLALVEKGLQKKHYNKIKKLYNWTDSEMVKIIGASVKSVLAMTLSNRFNVNASERLLFMAELGVLGIEVLGSKQNFQSWLNRPSPWDCDGKRPREFMISVYGFRELRDILMRIEHGIPP